jgi:5-methyltetrahydrofolate--homocysteine methyltransferase
VSFVRLRIFVVQTSAIHISEASVTQAEPQLEAFRTILLQVIEDGAPAAGVQMASDALTAGLSPLDFFRGVVEPVLADIGDRFSRLEIFLPELMRAGAVVKAMQAQVLEPAIKASGGPSFSEGTVIIGAAQGDIHDIGKNMVSLMLQVNGFKVVDLGTNIAPKAFIDAARRENADIIAMSSLLTPSMPYIRDTVQLVDGLGLRERFLLIAGGAPVTSEWAASIGLDGFGEDAVEAVEVCRRLMAKRRERSR